MVKIENYVHKNGTNGRYWDKDDIICLHESMETIKEYEDSPYFINHCSNCGYFATIKKERLKND